MAQAGSMRILYVNYAFQNHGCGPAVHGRSVVDAMRARGVEVDVFPGETPGTSGVGHGSAWRRQLRAHFPDEFLNLASGVHRTLRRTVEAWVRKRRALPDVVLGRHTGYDWTPWLVARALSRPLVLEVNAAMHLEKRMMGTSPPAVLRRAEEVQWRRASRIYAVSQELAGIVRAAGVLAARVRAIPNGARPLPFVDRERTSGDPVRILFVGGFHPWHGVEEVVRAMALLGTSSDDVELVLVGGGPRSESIRRLATDLGVADRVEMPGRVSHETVKDILHTADLGVAPYPPLNPFYFSPLKLFEYMAAGLPVVASAQGQISEVVKDGRTGILYPPGDTAALALALLALVRDPALRRRMGDAGRRRLERHYTWEHTVEGVIELCREAVREARVVGRAS